MAGYGQLQYGLGPYGLGLALPLGVSASGRAFDHNAFDPNAYDTDGVAVQQWGGAPRPFFSYSAKKLAWSERPLIPRIIPPVQPPAITGVVATSRIGGSVFAVGTVSFTGVAQTKHSTKQRVSIRGLYIPQAISGTSSTHRRLPSSVTAHGDVFDWDLVAEALMADAA